MLQDIAKTKNNEMVSYKDGTIFNTLSSKSHNLTPQLLYCCKEMPVGQFVMPLLQIYGLLYNPTEHMHFFQNTGLRRLRTS